MLDRDSIRLLSRTVSGMQHGAVDWNVGCYETRNDTKWHYSLLFVVISVGVGMWIHRTLESESNLGVDVDLHAST
jgi:hypothetical protein